MSALQKPWDSADRPLRRRCSRYVANGRVLARAPRTGNWEPAPSISAEAAAKPAFIDPYHNTVGDADNRLKGRVFIIYIPE
jgi:hypothetical protein